MKSELGRGKGSSQTSPPAQGELPQARRDPAVTQLRDAPEQGHPRNAAGSTLALTSRLSLRN